MRFKALSNDKRKLELNWDHINIYTSRWKPQTSFEIEIVKRQPKKSDPMRKYYFSAVLPPFMKELGYEADEELLFHHQAKARYFENDPEYNIYQDERGIWRSVPSVFGTDSDMPVPKKKAFVDWVVRKAAAAGVYIEDPGQT